MFTTIEGMYRDGKIELSEMPCDMCEGTPVLVTFLPSDSADLQTHGIDRAQVADLRQRLATLAEDWESPEMCICDDTVNDPLTRIAF